MSFCSAKAHFILLLNNNVSKGIPQFFHSPLEGHLGGFQVLVIMNQTVTYIFVQVFVWTEVLTCCVNAQVT